MGIHTRPATLCIVRGSGSLCAARVELLDLPDGRTAPGQATLKPDNLLYPKTGPDVPSTPEASGPFLVHLVNNRQARSPGLPALPDGRVGRPGNYESAGKRKSSRIPKGNVYLKTALVEAATAAAKAKGSYLRDNSTVSKLGAGTSGQSWQWPIRSW
jgi:hypothetical protein